MRRDAPRRAAKEYGAELARLIEEDDEYDLDDDETRDANGSEGNEDGERMDEAADGAEKANSNDRNGEAQTREARRSRRRGTDAAWNLEIPLGTENETERWHSGDMAQVYENALRTLQRLQGDADTEDNAEGNALATTVGKAERAGRAADVVEKM